MKNEMLVSLAIGDSAGAGFEYASEAFVTKNNDGKHYVAHPKYAALKPGIYTDDTQMSIAIAEAMVSGDDWTPLNLANRFVTAFHRDPRGGYARRFRAFLEQVKDGEQFLREIKPDSDKSGAAMRAAPLGMLPTIGSVLSKCRIQAALTHNTTDGMNAAMASSLLAYYFVHDCGKKENVGEFICRYVPGPWATKWEGAVGSKGWQSVWAAIHSVSACDSMTQLLKTCIGHTGDVDTVAAIALAAGSYCPDIQQDLAPELVDGLENGPYGREYLAKLDKQLAEKYSVSP
jgi:ADP-ribosylglycohydrolase